MREDKTNPLHEPRGAVVTEEQATSATHVGLWKILAASLVLVIVGFAIVSGFSN